MREIMTILKYLRKKYNYETSGFFLVCRLTYDNISKSTQFTLRTQTSNHMLDSGKTKNTWHYLAPRILCLICTSPLHLNSHVWLKVISCTVSCFLNVKILICIFREENEVTLCTCRKYIYIGGNFLQLLCMLYNYITAAWQFELQELAQNYSVRWFVLF